jgi:hypothetical protein
MDWVTSNEVRRAFGVTLRRGATIPAQLRALRQRAGEGLVRTRAKHLRVGETVTADQELPREFWARADDPLSLIQNWATGDFRRVGDPETLAIGVVFSRDDVEEMGVSFGEDLGPAINLGIKSQPKWDWEGALIALMGISELDGLADRFRLGERGGQTRLEEWLIQWFAKESDGNEPSRSEVRKRARAIMQGLPTV